MKYFPRILPYLKPYWPLAIALIVLTVAYVAFGLAMPWSMQILVDNVLEGKDPPSVLGFLPNWITDDRGHLLVFAVILGFTLAVLHEGAHVLSNFVNTKIEQHMRLDFRGDLFSHASKMSMAFHDHRRAGSLIYAINFQASAAPGILLAIPLIAQSVLTLLAMFWILSRIDMQIALLTIAVVPLLYVYITYYATHIQKRLRQVKHMEARSLSIIHEGISMIRLIAAFGRERHEFNRFRGQGLRAVDARLDVTLRQTLFNMAVNSTTAGGTALVLGFGAFRALHGQITIGQLLVVISYLAAVYKPLETISYTIGGLQEKFVSLQVAFRLLDTPPDIVDKPGARRIQRAKGDVAYRDVSFKYQRRQEALSNISFEAPAGCVVGVVGPTGAGKTTLVSLLPRFYQPTKGHITLDGRDIGDLTISSLRKQISIVPQEPLLFSGTIADNIRYSELTANESQVIEAAKAAHADGFISALPKQYETQVGERGVQLSGGERQRICIARAFLKDAPILILDEPTSAVDARTEGTILDAIDRLLVGRTTFIISHRQSTLRKADMILVIDEGRIVEQGTHAELSHRGGLYRQLFDPQAGEGFTVTREAGDAALFCPHCGRQMTRWLQSRNNIESFICRNCRAKLDLPSGSIATAFEGPEVEEEPNVEA
jgi:ABC-type multidrug transport system fused ATPase/permease subunit